ncbi:hypothetical protein THIOKS13020002 [Thiocapsa sp. KS1]|jgi:hypothetical protein|nr:hypothetical protein THIOKS13020002 [Thiocapsa sp. KS1]
MQIGVEIPSSLPDALQCTREVFAEETKIGPCRDDRPEAPPTIGAKRQHPGIDDLQSSSSVGPTARTVDVDSTIPDGMIIVQCILFRVSIAASTRGH